MARGAVKWFLEEKGYGFITPKDGGEDAFVHFSWVAEWGLRSLEEGEKVAYEASRDAKGSRATKVRKV